jgi:hypothetical protein
VTVWPAVDSNQQCNQADTPNTIMTVLRPDPRLDTRREVQCLTTTYKDLLVVMDTCPFMRHYLSARSCFTSVQFSYVLHPFAARYYSDWMWHLVVAEVGLVYRWRTHFRKKDRLQWGSLECTSTVPNLCLAGWPHHNTAEGPPGLHHDTDEVRITHCN